MSVVLEIPRCWEWQSDRFWIILLINSGTMKLLSFLIKIFGKLTTNWGLRLARNFFSSKEVKEHFNQGRSISCRFNKYESSTWRSHWNLGSQLLWMAPHTMGCFKSRAYFGMLNTNQIFQSIYSFRIIKNSFELLRKIFYYLLFWNFSIVWYFCTLVNCFFPRVQSLSGTILGYLNIFQTL